MAFSLGALGAGLGQFAEQYRQQQESALRQQQMQMQMAQYQQRMQEQQQQRQAQAGLWGGLMSGAIGGDAQPIPGQSLGGPAVRSGGDLGGGLRAGGALTGGSDPRNLIPYIQETARKYNIDPSVAVQVARSEGLANPIGDGGKSGGAFQLYTGGGVGNEFQRDTGLSPLDPGNERQTIDYALKKAAQVGWGPWHGAARVGIQPWQGINRQGAPQVQPASYAQPAGAPAPAADDGLQRGLSVEQYRQQYGQDYPPGVLEGRAIGAPAPTQRGTAAGRGDAVVSQPKGGAYAQPLPSVGSEGERGGGQAVGKPPPALSQSVIAPSIRPAGAPRSSAPGQDSGDYGGGADLMAPVRQEVQQGIQSVAKITPPSVYGRMGLQGLVRQIEKAAPGSDPAVKMMMLEEAQKLLAPDAARQWDLYKQDRSQDLQREMAVFTHNLNLDKAGTWTVMTNPEDGKQFRYNATTAQATDMSGTPITVSGAAKLGGAGGASDSLSGGRRQIMELEVKTRLDRYKAENPNATPEELNVKKVEFWREAERGIAGAKATPTAPHNIEVRDYTTNEVLYRGLARPAPDYSGYVQPNGEKLPDGKTMRTGDSQPRNETQMLMQKYLDENPWATAQDAEQYRANRILNDSAMRAFGGGPIARNVIALNTVADHILRVQEYADALANGAIPRANQVVNQLAKERGLPEITTFQAGRDIMADEVVRLLTATGGTRGDREGMQKTMSEMMSPEQFAGVFDMLKHMTGGRFEALKQQFVRGDPKRGEMFDNQLLSPKGRQVFLAITGGDPMVTPPAERPSAAAPGAAPGAPPPASPAPAPGGRTYRPGEVIEKGGRRFRVIGGDPNDPDVEEIR